MAKTSTTASKKDTKAKGDKPAKEKKEKAPPKPSTSATQEEIEAAIAGTLKPRADHGSKGQENLTRTDEKGRPAGRPLGVTTGLPILMAWCYAFQQNEKVPKKDRLTDEGISKFMKSEFPGRTTPAFDHPQLCRRDYNNGKFTKEQKPKVQSNRYDENGDVTTSRGGGRVGRPKKGAGAEKGNGKGEAESKPAKPAKKTVTA